MAGDLEDLKQRLVVGHKRGGRCIYDEAAKSELVELCLQPGASVSRLARECCCGRPKTEPLLKVVPS